MVEKIRNWDTNPPRGIPLAAEVEYVEPVPVERSMFNIDWGNVISRALWTAVQAFLSVFAVASIASIEDAKNAAVAGAVAAGAAVLSFVKTFITEKLGA
jgi:hypothetical protein